MGTLSLIRHGESEWNALQRLQGHLDVPLSPRGRAQSRALASLVSPPAPGRVLCSDLRRARETAQELGVTVGAYDGRWREIGLGVWAGAFVRDADAESDQLGNWRGGPYTPAEGEPWARFAVRIGDAVDALAAAGGDWLVITHGGCIRAACAHVTGDPAASLPTTPNGSVTRLRLAPGRALLAYGLLPQGAPATGLYPLAGARRRTG
jgi:broad specificity phosphatase PhoE